MITLIRLAWFFAAAVLLAATPACNSTSEPQSSIPMDKDDIAGTVRGEMGPEAGVWVIAESTDFDTFFARIVVTDANGQYLVPDLPAAKYQLWVRGYGLEDSAKISVSPGETADLRVIAASDAQTAAKVYPAAYWYAMLELPTEEEVADIPGGLNNYLMWIKNMGCVGCHQMGNLATRTLPPSLGKFESSEQAWARRISSGQAGGSMTRIAGGLLKGVPFRYYADWTDRIANGATPADIPVRPSGLERNVVVTPWNLL